MALLDRNGTMAKKWLASAAVFFLLLSSPAFNGKAVAQRPPPLGSCLMNCGVKMIRCVTGCMFSPICYSDCGIGNLRCITLCFGIEVSTGHIPPVFQPITRREGATGAEMAKFEEVVNMISSSSNEKNGRRDPLQGIAKAVASAYASENGVMGGFEVMAKITSSRDTNENGVRGTLQFFQDSNEKTTHIKGTILGLSPGIHGLCIHSAGSCSSTKPRFNPINKVHGATWTENHHVIDLGNIAAGPDGIAEVSIEAETFQLNGFKSIIGWAIVVHDANNLGSAQHEDSNITRNSGAALVCGIIEIKPSS